MIRLDSICYEIQHAIKTSNLPSKDIHCLVAGAGTGGTITGLSRALRDEERGRWPVEEEVAEREVKREVEGFERERKGMQREEGVSSGSGSGSDVEVVLASSVSSGSETSRSGQGEQTLRSKMDKGRGIVVGVDPVGSILGGGDVGNYVVEGIG